MIRWATFALAVVIGGPAQAEPVFGGGELVQLLPPGEVLADGHTVTALHLLAMDADGGPIEGLELKATVQKSEVSAASVVAPGLYRLEVVPPATGEPTAFKVRVSGKNEAGAKVSAKGTLETVPAFSRTVTMSLTPPEGFTLGERDQATVYLDISQDIGQPVEPGDLTLLVSEGTVENLTDMGDGRFSALYRPPQIDHPTLALFTVVDQRAPEVSWAYGVLPLSAKTEVPVRGEAGEQVLLMVGERSYGPFEVPKGGEVMVPIEVGPGALTGKKVIIGDGGKRTEEEVALELPMVRRVQLFPLPRAMAADPERPVVVRALVTEPGGALAEAASVSFGSEVGKATAGRPISPGIYEGRFTPAPGNALQPATLQVSLDTDEAQVHGLDFQRVPARPRKVVLTPEPAVVDKGKVPFAVRIDVTGPEDGVLSEREVVLNAVGARVEELVASKDGGYLAQLKALGSGPIELKASAPTPGSDNPLYRVLMFPSTDALPNNGLSNSMLTVLTVDRLGYPVPGVDVNLRVEGEATLPSQGTSDASGMLQVFLTAGRTPGMLTVTADASGHTARTHLVQHAGVWSGVVDLPDPGDAETTTWIGQWRDIVTEALVQRK